MAKNALEEIIDDLVVFRNEGHENSRDRGYVSNSAMWADGRIRKAWLNKYADAEDSNQDGVIDEKDEELPAYDTLTNEELRGELVARGLSVEGKKADMIARLEAADEADQTAK